MSQCIKLLRKYFLNKGNKLNESAAINSEIIKKVLVKDAGEVKLCYKLKLQILGIKENERKNVFPAKALISAAIGKSDSLFHGKC